MKKEKAIWKIQCLIKNQKKIGIGNYSFTTKTAAQ